MHEIDIEVGEKKSAGQRSDTLVCNPSAGSRQLFVHATARLVPSERHRLLFENDAILDLWLLLEGRQCSSLRVFGINRNAKFALSACRGEVCISMTPTLINISRINNFVFECCIVLSMTCERAQARMQSNASDKHVCNFEPTVNIIISFSRYADRHSLIVIRSCMCAYVFIDHVSFEHS